MGRLRRLFNALASGYSVLLANVVFSLAQVPLALSFLSKAEFALWALAFQLGTYLQLVDFGMSSSVSRLLIDHKHEPNAGPYGGIIKTGFLVLAVQGSIVFLGGTAFAFGLSHWLNIEPELLPTFRFLLVGLCAMLAVTFLTKIFTHVLTAHQRMDLISYAQIVLLAVNYLVQWFCLHRGVGVFSILWGNAAGWVLMSLIMAVACVMLKLFPAPGAWGKATRARFFEIFRYGRDLFWVALGTQLIVGSQTIIITQVLGLDAAAIWSVCTRTYTLVSQVTWRIFDYSMPALAEMMVFNERERLYSRLKSLTIVSASLAVVAGALFAVCNQPFIAIWTQGKIGWPRYNDALLAVWLVVSSLVHSLCGFVLVTKAIGFMRYIYFIEGLVFVIGSSLLAGVGGIPLVILTSIVCTSLFSLPYGIWRTRNYFDVPVGEMPRAWLIPPLRLLLIMAPLAAVIWLLGIPLSPRMQLIAATLVLGCAGAALLLRLGIQRQLKEEIRERAPKIWRPALAVIMSRD